MRLKRSLATLMIMVLVSGCIPMETYAQGNNQGLDRENAIRLDYDGLSFITTNENKDENDNIIPYYWFEFVAGVSDKYYTINFERNSDAGSTDPVDLTETPYITDAKIFDAEGNELPATCAPGETTVLKPTDKLEKNKVYYIQAFFSSNAQHIYMTIPGERYIRPTKSWEITYNLNGGTGTAPVDSEWYFSSDTLDYYKVYSPDNDPAAPAQGSMVAPAGATFAGWKDGTGKAYAAGDKIASTTDVVLYAQWTIPSSSADANSTEAGTDRIASGDRLVVIAENGINYAAYTITATAPTLTAGADDSTAYTVTYNGNGSTGGSVPIDNNSPYVSGATVTVLDNTGSLEKENYTFGGWSYNGITYQKDSTFTMPSANVTLTAVWTPIGNWSDGITSVTTTWDSGGTISTAAELAQFAYNVNHGKDYWSQTITLENDIDLSGGDWTPIGGKNGCFKGTFDGNSKKITGITIGSSSSPESGNLYSGLFGNIKDSTIKNLGVDVAIYSNAGYGHVGGLVGCSSGDNTITNCYVTGNVTGGANALIGGLAGTYSGTCFSGITNSYATGDVTGGASATVGGLVGLNSGPITNSYATGDVTGGDSANVGGLAGGGPGIITNNYTRGNVIGGANANVGGLVGLLAPTVQVIIGYATGDVTGGANANVGGLAGNAMYPFTGNVGFWNSDAAQIVDGVAQTPKKGYGKGDYAPLGMTSGDMKSASFVTKLNDKLDFYKDITLQIWQENTGDYPTFSGTYWSAPATIGKAITISTTAPVSAATIENGTCTPPAGASGPVITWSADYGISWTASGSFAADTIYQTQYVYTANTGYQFDRTISKNDIAVSGGSVDLVTVYNSSRPNDTLYVKVSWEKTGASAGEGAVAISGTVRDKDGNPVSGATVALAPAVGTPNPATTGNDGKYTINDVPAGSYTVTVTLPNGGGSFTQNITVPGGSMDIQQPAAPTYTVSGSVKDAADGGSVSGATVTLTNTTDDTKTYTGTTDINGKYTITGVPDGSYTVNVTKGGETYDCGNAGITVSGSNVSGGSGNITVTISTYTVSYDGNVNSGGTVPVDNTSYKKASYARVMSSGNLTKSGFTFGGWNTSSTGGGISYKVNDTFVINGNVTLYAQWKAVDSAQIPIFTYSNVRGMEAVTQYSVATELSVTATVSDGGDLSYQWYYQCAPDTTDPGIVISGATDSNYTPPADTVGTSYYYVVVTNTNTIKGETKAATNTSGIKTVLVLSEPTTVYDVSSASSASLNNITLDNTSATQYQNYTTNISSDSGYTLPDSITVTMGGRTLVDGVDYIYSKTSPTTGAVIVYNVTGELSITAEGVQILTQNYTISFNANGSDAAVSAVSGKYGDPIILPTPTKTGFSFAGWYRDSGFATSYVSTTFGKEDITLYAKWEPITYNISGNVKDEDNANVDSATVKLMAGSRQIAQASTDVSGNYTISGVPAGTYNLVITKGDQTITLTITVSDSNVATGKVTLPKGKKNSVVEVKENTPDIVVDKLNDFFDSDKFTQDDSNVVDSGGTVEIKLLAEKKDETGDNAAANADSIKTSATGNGKTVGIYLNLTVSKIITPASGTAEQPVLINQLNDLLVIDIPLPSELQGKSGYVIYRYHGSEVQTISETPNPDGEYFVLSADGKSVKLYTKKFSTYAVGYTSDYTPSGSGSSGSSGSTVSAAITAIQAEGGKIDISADKKTAAISPDDGYAIADVQVDGKSIGAANQYTIADSSNHKITAVFVKISELPYYLKDGVKVYVGFSKIVGNVYKYIAPDGVKVEFKENPKNFIDNTIAWAKPSIDCVTEREIFLGTDIDRFSPNEGMTRAMFVAVIGRLYERSYGSVSGTSTFSDVDASSYYSKYVGWANDNGIIKGVGGNKFAPNDKVTREQMAVIMRNFAALLKKADIADGLLTYTDSTSISPWAIEGAKYCQETKVITGRDGGIFAPQESATRAEASAILQRFIANMLK